MTSNAAFFSTPSTLAPYNPNQWVQCFPVLRDENGERRGVFADNSSRAQMPRQTLDAVTEQLQLWETHRGGHPAWDSARAARAAHLRTRARRAAADLCGAAEHQIGFAANGTSTLAILARAMVGTVLRPGDVVVITEADHDANRLPWQALEAQGVRVIDVPVAPDGGLDPQAWARVLTQRPRVVALCMLSNVTGVLLPFERLAQEAHQVGSVVVLDAVQGPVHGYTNIMVPEVDVAVFSNCKLFSPHLGWWAISDSLLHCMQLEPAVGAHPSLEWGSFAHANFAGFLATHDHLCSLTSRGTLADGMAAIRAHEAQLHALFVESLPMAWRPHLLAADTQHPQVPIFSLALHSSIWQATRLAFEHAGIDVRIGQFGTPATLRRLAPQTDATALRLSFVHYNTLSDVLAVCEVLDSLGLHT